MRWLLDKNFAKRLKRRHERYDIQAGILADKPHYEARSQFRKKGRGKKGRLVKDLTSVEGMKARKKSRVRNGTVAQLSKELRRRTGINIFTEPFRSSPSREVKRFRKALINFFGASGGSAQKRKIAEQRLVEVIQTPIRKRRYGSNSPQTILTKGFNRRLFDTGQLYKAIRAKIKILPGGGKHFGPFKQ